MLSPLPRLALAVGVAVTLATGLGGAALADLGDPVACTADPTTPRCRIQVSTPGGAGVAGSAGCADPRGRPVPCFIEGKGWLGEGSCYFQPAAGTELAAAQALGGVLDPPARWYVGSCGDPVADFWPANLVVFRAYGTSPGAVLLAREAVRRLELPAPRIRLNPGPAAPQVTFVPTWLWIDPVVWAPRSATASLAGLSVTATGTPVRVTWSTGDGDRVVCGAGTEWVPGTDPAATSPDCGHTYTTASRSAPGGRFIVTASITWQVTWAGGGASGTEPALTSTASVPVLVVESSALTTAATGGQSWR